MQKVLNGNLTVRVPVSILIILPMGRNEGIRFVSRFQQLRSYRDEIETWNREEIPFSS